MYLHCFLLDNKLSRPVMKISSVFVYMYEEEEKWLL